MASDGIWSELRMATPAEEYWKRDGLSAKGEFGGRCHSHFCGNPGATWYNRGSGKYYCQDCAGIFNDICKQENMPQLCELRA